MRPTAKTLGPAKLLAVFSFSFIIPHADLPAQITWLPVTNISGYNAAGTNDVDRVGSFVFGVNFGGPNIPSIPFATDPFTGFAANGGLSNTGPFTGQTNFTLSSTAGINQITSGMVGGAATNLPPAYQTLLNSAIFETAPLQLQLTGLIPFAVYRLQLWVHWSSHTGLTETVTDGVNSATLEAAYSGPGPNHDQGEWVIGTFTAPPTGVQSLSIINATVPTGVTILNGMQLRVVPEPFDTCLGLGGSFLLLAVTRKTLRAR